MIVMFSLSIQLQHKLMTMSDRDVLRQVVDVIQESQNFTIDERTFSLNFDLCNLDRNTLHKLRDTIMTS